MRLFIDHLPVSFERDGDEQIKIHTYRHWIVYDDGRIYYQDERITVEGPDLGSERGEWQQLPTPPMAWEVAGVLEHGGLPMAILKNGRAYIWGRAEGEVVHRWVPFEDPIPDTPAYREYIT